MGKKNTAAVVLHNKGTYVKYKHLYERGMNRRQARAWHRAWVKRAADNPQVRDGAKEV